MDPKHTSLRRIIRATIVGATKGGIDEYRSAAGGGARYPRRFDVYPEDGYAPDEPAIDDPEESDGEGDCGCDRT
jgi:hypothetical protein